MSSGDVAALAIAGEHGGDAIYIVFIVMSALVLIAVGVPMMVMNHRLKSRQLAMAEAQDTTATKGLWDTARRMEERIGYLETVLDTEVPGWRSRSNVR